MNFNLPSKGCMQVPSDLVAMGSVYVGFFDTQSSDILNNIFGKCRKKNSEQRTKLTKTNVLIIIIDGVNINGIAIENIINLCIVYASLY